MPVTWEAVGAKIRAAFEAQAKDIGMEQALCALLALVTVRMGDELCPAIYIPCSLLF